MDASGLLRELDIHWQEHLKAGCAFEPVNWGQLGLAMLEYYATHTITIASLLEASCLAADKVPCLATPVRILKPMLLLSQSDYIESILLQICRCKMADLFRHGPATMLLESYLWIL